MPAQNTAQSAEEQFDTNESEEIPQAEKPQPKLELVEDIVNKENPTKEDVEQLATVAQEEISSRSSETVSVVDGEIQAAKSLEERGELSAEHADKVIIDEEYLAEVEKQTAENSMSEVRKSLDETAKDWDPILEDAGKELDAQAAVENQDDNNPMSEVRKSLDETAKDWDPILEDADKTLDTQTKIEDVSNKYKDILEIDGMVEKKAQKIIDGLGEADKAMADELMSEHDFGIRDVVKTLVLAQREGQTLEQFIDANDKNKQSKVEDSKEIFDSGDVEAIMQKLEDSPETSALAKQALQYVEAKYKHPSVRKHNLNETDDEIMKRAKDLVVETFLRSRDNNTEWKSVLEELGIVEGAPSDKKEDAGQEGKTEQEEAKQLTQEIEKIMGEFNDDEVDAIIDNLENNPENAAMLAKTMQRMEEIYNSEGMKRLDRGLTAEDIKKKVKRAVVKDFLYAQKKNEKWGETPQDNEDDSQSTEGEAQEKSPTDNDWVPPENAYPSVGIGSGEITIGYRDAKVSFTVVSDGIIKKHANGDSFVNFDSVPENLKASITKTLEDRSVDDLKKYSISESAIAFLKPEPVASKAESGSSDMPEEDPWDELNAEQEDNLDFKKVDQNTKGNESKNEGADEEEENSNPKPEAQPKVDKLFGINPSPNGGFDANLPSGFIDGKPGGPKLAFGKMEKHFETEAEAATAVKEAQDVMNNVEKETKEAEPNVEAKKDEKETKMDSGTKQALINRQQKILSGWDNPQNRSDEEQSKFAFHALYDELANSSDNSNLISSVDKLRRSWLPAGDYDPNSEEYKLQTGEALKQILNSKES